MDFDSSSSDYDDMKRKRVRDSSSSQSLGGFMVT